MSVDAAQQRIRALLQQADGLERQKRGVLFEAAAIARQFGIPYETARAQREAARSEVRRRGRSEEGEYGHE
jgi:hypothetical protein